MKIFYSILITSFFLIFSLNAKAQTYNLNEPQYSVPGGSTGIFTVDTQGDFKDIFNFSLSGISEIQVLGSGFKSVLDFYRVELYTGFDALSDPSYLISGIEGSFGSFELAALDADSLTGSDFSLLISGKTFADNTTYTLEVTGITSVVSEPGVISLMLLGLSLVGFMARRRNV